LDLIELGPTLIAQATEPGDKRVIEQLIRHATAQLDLAKAETPDAVTDAHERLGTAADNLEDALTRLGAGLVIESMVSGYQSPFVIKLLAGLDKPADRRLLRGEAIRQTLIDLNQTTSGLALLPSEVEALRNPAIAGRIRVAAAEAINQGHQARG